MMVTSLTYVSFGLFGKKKDRGAGKSERMVIGGQQPQYASREQIKQAQNNPYPNGAPIGKAALKKARENRNRI